MNAISRIEELLDNLPQKDAILAKDLLSSRRFEDLYALVKSDIIIVEKEQSKENPKEKYKDIDLESLELLKAEIKDYYSNIVEDIEDYE